MRKKGLIFIVIAAVLFWGYYYLFALNKKKIVKKSKKGLSAMVDGLRKANSSLLRACIEDFHARTGKYPQELQELVTRGFIGKVPSGDWNYDPKTGTIK
jgi:hypothetical protein